MHYIQQNTDLEERAKNFVGKTVRDTFNRVGVVQQAYARESLIVLSVLGTKDHWFSDHEHATIVSLGDYSQPGAPPSLTNGELEE